MDEDREELIQVVTASQVANAKLFNGIHKENALWAKYMLNEFKKFLNNSNITTLERQSLLMKFLMEHTNYEVIHEVMEYIDQCELKNDYSVIIMEWTLHNSQSIMEHLLVSYDGLNLMQSIPKNKKDKLVIPKLIEKDKGTKPKIKIIPIDNNEDKLPKGIIDGLNLLISEILNQEGISNIDGTAGDIIIEDYDEQDEDEDQDDDQ